MKAKDKMKIFIGGPATGKSWRARDITEGKNTVWINRLDLKKILKNPFTFRDVTENTEYIVFEDVLSGINNLARMLYSDKIEVNKPYEKSIIIPRPKIIIIADCNAKIFPTDASFNRRFQIIDFNTPKMAALLARKKENCTCEYCLERKNQFRLSN